MESTEKVVKSEIYDRPEGEGAGRTLPGPESEIQSEQKVELANVPKATEQTKYDNNSVSCASNSNMSSECSSHLAQLLTNSPAATSSAGSSTSSGNMNLKAELGIGQQSVQKQTVGTSSEPFYCASCGKNITDRYLLKAMDKYWHEDCLKCACCQCRLAEDGCKLYYKEGMHLCKRDYMRLFGLTGLCAACHKSIPAYEMVMRARANVYHLECFGCQQCNYRFCVGDKFYLWDNKILCEYDYQERTLFAQMASNYNSIAQLKRQFPDDLDVETKRSKLRQIQATAPQ